MRFAVFASGRGSNLQAIHKAVLARQISAELTLVVSDRKDAYALVYATDQGVAAMHINPKDFPDRESFDKAVLQKLHQHQIDFVVLAGYMRLLSSPFISAYKDKILNIHPSLLPSFKGTHAIRDAFEHGAKVTGPTVHIVVDAMDDGPIILQEPVRIEPNDTLESLEAKIHQAEYRIYPQAIDLFARGKLKIEGRRVIFLP